MYLMHPGNLCNFDSIRIPGRLKPPQKRNIMRQGRPRKRKIETDPEEIKSPKGSRRDTVSSSTAPEDAVKMQSGETDLLGPSPSGVMETASGNGHDDQDDSVEQGIPLSETESSSGHHSITGGLYKDKTNAEKLDRALKLARAFRRNQERIKVDAAPETKMCSGSISICPCGEVTNICPEVNEMIRLSRLNIAQLHQRVLELEKAIEALWRDMRVAKERNDEFEAKMEEMAPILYSTNYRLDRYEGELQELRELCLNGSQREENLIAGCRALVYLARQRIEGMEDSEFVERLAAIMETIGRLIDGDWPGSSP